MSFPENCKIVEAIPPQVGAAATVTSDYISLKNAHKAWIVLHYNTAGNAETFQPLKATAVAPTGSVNITNVVKIWSNLDTATSDTLVERTAATSYACDNGATKKIIIFEIDPADLGETYDCIAVVTTAIAAGDYISGIFVIQPRYASAVAEQPSVITD
jgi:hypothetical protein